MMNLELITKISTFCIYIFLFFLVVASPFLISGGLYFLYRVIIKKDRLPKREHEAIEYKPRNFFLRLFWDFPKRFVSDLFERNPDAFPECGFHLFAGEQGSGKSMAMVELAHRLGMKYPKCSIASNIDLSFQDEKIENWEDLVFKNNGEFGQMVCLDEIQNWFNCKESKDMPVEMIQDICQQRKQRKMILGTSQQFSNVAKVLRTQVYLLYKPITVFGCLTIVRVYKPVVNEAGEVKKLHRRKTYFFVHSDELRNAYDTYERVKRMSLKGFVPRTEQLGNSSYFQTSTPAPEAEKPRKR